MNQLQNRVKIIAVNVINKIAASEPSEWPPTCPFFSYQPVRPQVGIELETKKNSTTPTEN